MHQPIGDSSSQPGGPGFFRNAPACCMSSLSGRGGRALAFETCPSPPGRFLKPLAAITHQAALGHQVEGLGGHQGRHQYQRHRVLLRCTGMKLPSTSSISSSSGQAVVPDSHQVAVVHQFKPGPPGLDQGVALEQPVGAIGGALASRRLSARPCSTASFARLFMLHPPRAAPVIFNSASALPR